MTSESRHMITNNVHRDHRHCIVSLKDECERTRFNCEQDMQKTRLQVKEIIVSEHV
jgi:hypothetical protein